MKNIRRYAIWISGISMVALAAGGGSYAAAAAGGTAKGSSNASLQGLPPPRLQAGKWIPNQTVPHGSNEIPKPPRSLVPSVATPVPGPYDNQVLTAKQVATVGIPLPFPYAMMNLTTAYFGIRANDDFSLYTGTEPGDPSEAVIVVYDQQMDNAAKPFSPSGEFTIRGAGALMIRSVNGAVATVEDAAGHPHTLNVITHAFSG